MPPRSASRILEAGFWIAAVILIGLFFGARVLGEHERSGAVAQFHAMQAEQRSTAPAGTGPANPSGVVDASLVDAPDQSEWSTTRIQTHDAHTADPNLDDGAPLAVLRIDRIGVEVPVYADISERNLNRGAGLVQGTAAPGEDGNVGIAAHRDGYFRALRNVVVGDLLEVHSAAGHRRYEVTDLWIVDPNEVWVLDDTVEAVVTLVTCFPFYFVGHAPQRFIVRARATP